MKKSIISLTLLATLMFGAEYSNGLELISNDVNTLNSDALSSIKTLSTSETALQDYVDKIDVYEGKVANFTEGLAKEFTSKDDAENTINQLDKLSTESVSLAKTVAYLASHQGDNVNESYQETLQTASKTVLRLSDDIGKMADRILVMADDIGVMSDRIVKTQEIQSVNFNTTAKLTQYAMTLSSGQVDSTRTTVSQHTMNPSVMGQNAMPQATMPQNPSPQTSISKPSTPTTQTMPTMR